MKVIFKNFNPVSILENLTFKRRFKKWAKNKDDRDFERIELAAAKRVRKRMKRITDAMAGGYGRETQNMMINEWWGKTDQLY